MKLAYKQMARQVFRNRIFVALLSLLAILTTLSFFFVKFTIDGNEGRVQEITAMGGDAARYQTALRSNNILAYVFLVAMTVLTAFVFLIFFYRFFRSSRKQMGCLKALGFRDRDLRLFFVGFAAALTLIGGLVGLAAAWPMSEILLRANVAAYGVTGLVKGLRLDSVAVGLLGQCAVMALVAFACYGFVRGKEPGSLIAGNLNAAGYSPALSAANALTDALPVKNKFPLRIALRKPLAVLLILVAVMSFNVFVIMGRALNISSQTVMESQTAGRNYEYDLLYPSFRDGGAAGGKDLRYAKSPGTIAFDDTALDYSILSLYGQGELFTLLDGKGDSVALPEEGQVVIGPGLGDTYGLKAGDALKVRMAQGEEMMLQVSAVAANAEANSVYVNAGDFTANHGLPPGAFNGEYMDGAPDPARIADGTVSTRQERIDFLKRDAVSNDVSAVINQATGVLVGCILFFLALYVNFQDNTRDMLILHLMGYRVKAIRKMLIDIYRPLVWVCFAVTLLPSIWIAKAVLRGLSISTGDYMPFGTNFAVILIAFVALTLLYQLVQWVFGAAIKRVIRREDIAEYTGAE